MQAFVIINVGTMINDLHRECKKLIDKILCDKGSIWNPSNFECKCDKSCDIGEIFRLQKL